MPKCDRCRKDAPMSTMSRFNVSMICMECEALEKAHPSYKQARDAEYQAVVNGNLNFAGIGKPSDL